MAKHGDIFSSHPVPGTWQVFKTSNEDVKQPAIYVEKTFDLSFFKMSLSPFMCHSLYIPIVSDTIKVNSFKWFFLSSII